MDKMWILNEDMRIAELIAQKDQALASLREERKELDAAKEAHANAVAAQGVISGLAKAAQQQAHKRISSVVSTCLAAVFDDPYQLNIEFEQKRGRTEARVTFVRDGNQISPMDASGGGALDVAAFALRAACLVLHRPRLRRVMVLDEPFKNVSKGYQPAVRAMLEQLSRDLKIQIVMVTHNEAYECGKVVEL